MRHRVGQRKLQRTTPHRLAMLKNMVTSLLEHERIKTTLPKAKEARPLAERMITLGKRGGLANQRLAARTLRTKAVVTKVFTELKDRYATRPGGYTRIVRLGWRNGDAAEVAFIELVDRPAAAAASTEPEKGAAEVEKTEKASPAPKKRAKKSAKSE